MANHAFFEGTVMYGENHKMKIMENLPEHWNIFLMARINNPNLVTNRKINVTYFYDHPLINKKLSREEIRETEKWLGHPFRLLLQYNYQWKKEWEEDKNKLWKFYEMTAKAILVWKDFFTRNKIEIFSNNMECMNIEIAGVEVAKKLGIKIINYNGARIANHYHLLDPNFHQLQWKEVSKEEAEELVSAFKNSIEKRAEPQGMELSKVVASKGSLSWSNLSKRFENLKKNIDYYYKLPKMDQEFRRSPWRVTWEFIRGEFRKKVVPFFYDKADLEKPYFFFPLHYTLETQLSYMEAFSDQFKIFSDIARALPIDNYIYVKPHPHWLCSDLSISKIQELKKIPQVKFINANISPFELIKKSKAVVTIDSTTGIEAMALKKPLITFGHEFYAEEGSAIVIRDFNDLPDAVQRALSDPESTWDEEKRIINLGRFLKHLIPVQSSFGPPYHLSDEEGRAIANAMVECYKNCKDSKNI